LNLLVHAAVFSTANPDDGRVDLKSRQKRSYTEYGPKKSDIALLKLTKKADYGLIALKYLAEHPERPALSAKDVADAYGIPAQLLAKILQRLTKTGLLRSHAGMNGGYALARDARQISAYEVILAIDGPFFITSCTKGKKGCELDAELHHQGAAGASERHHRRRAEEHQHSRSGGARATGGTRPERTSQRRGQVGFSHAVTEVFPSARN
jgi:Rrf2 family protein